MKPLSRKQLVEKSAQIFKAHNVASVFATVDGQFFIVKDRAQLHNNTLKDAKVYEIERTEAIETPKAEAKKEAPKAEAKKEAPKAEDKKEAPKAAAKK